MSTLDCDKTLARRVARRFICLRRIRVFNKLTKNISDGTCHMVPRDWDRFRQLCLDSANVVKYLPRKRTKIQSLYKMGINFHLQCITPHSVYTKWNNCKYGITKGYKNAITKKLEAFLAFLTTNHFLTSGTFTFNRDHKTYQTDSLIFLFI